MADAKIRDLEQRLSAMRDLNVELESKVHESRPTNVVVNSFKDRKIAKFTGAEDVDEWTQTVRVYVDSKSSSEREKVAFILDHLGEDAKTEVRLEIDPTKSKATELLEVLRNVYGVKESIFELQQIFYGRDQSEDESISEYSHVLMKHLFSMQKKAPEVYGDSETILKQRFGEGVRELSLKRELKRLNRESPGLKFFQLRDQAIAWEKDTATKTSSEGNMFESLTQTVQHQQQQIESLTSSLQQQAEVSEQRYQSGRGRGNRSSKFQKRDYQQKDDNKDESSKEDKDSTSEIVCHYCNQPNHIQPFCWKKRQDMKKKRANPSN